MLQARATRPLLLLIAISIRAASAQEPAPLGVPAPGAIVLLSADSARARSDGARSRTLDRVRITGRIDDLTGVATTASEGVVGASELRLRPLMREGELLETVPGMIVTQHSGDGKANQLFVRGFNLDHGTDFQSKLDGMPLNMPSHAHGQGYTDLNFLIPELVSRIEYHLGVSHASLGDFGSAGGAEFRFFDALPHPFLTVEGGQFGFARLAGGGSSAVGPGTVLAAAELKGYDGPWLRAEQLRKASGLVKYAWRVGGSQFSVLGMAYHNAWNASDQVPQRAVDGGLINSFGQIDSTLGGETSRYSLSGTWSHIGGASVQMVQLFGIRSSLNLFSNFTYGLVDSTAGDQFNQRESRTIVGGNASHHVQVEAWGVSHTLTFGLQHRSDFVRGLGLYRTLRRQRLSIVRQDDVSESGTGLYLEAVSRWLPWFRSTIGVRGDAYAFDVSGDRPENGGSRSATLASPKVSLAFTPVEGTELYVSGGLGFHSNDARGTTIRRDPVTGARVDRVDPLVRSRGVEVGLRTSPLPGWRATFAAWALDLDSELLFVGDGGTTAPSSRSSRQGVTLANFYRPGRSLAFDLDVSFARARFGGVAPGQGFVPGSLEQVVAAGVTYGGGTGAFVALRLRHFGAYPLAGDNRVRATPATLLNGDLGYQFGAVRVQLSLLNLLDSNARDIQYFYTSRLSGEPAGGVGDVHYHQMEPRQVRVAMRRDW